MHAVTREDAIRAQAEVDASRAFTPMTGPYFAAITDRERVLAAARETGTQPPAYAAPAPLDETQLAARARELEARILTGLRPGQPLTEDARRLAGI